MNKLDFKILAEECENDFSLEDVKGGMGSGSGECCSDNHACNVNTNGPAPGDHKG